MVLALTDITEDVEEAIWAIPRFELCLLILVQALRMLPARRTDTIEARLESSEHECRIAPVKGVSKPSTFQRGARLGRRGRQGRIRLPPLPGVILRGCREAM